MFLRFLTALEGVSPKSTTAKKARAAACDKCGANGMEMPVALVKGSEFRDVKVCSLLRTPCF